jgi:CheY-like chemotaxis protein
MQTMRNVLIADPNTAFATVVGEALKRMGGYSFRLAASGPEAEQLCAQLRPDLAVIDVDLPECQPADLIGRLRSLVPGLPIILIPYSQDDVPSDLDIQGILTKPFFLPDLPELINSILGPLPEPEPQPDRVMAVPLSATRPRRIRETPPAKPIVITEKNRALVEGHVAALGHAVRDEPVLLTLGKKVITIAPHLSKTAASALAEVVVRAWDGRDASPGSEVVRFEGDSESTRYMLYSYVVTGELMLSLALRVRIPLPTLRKLVHEAAAQLIHVVTES